MDLESPIVHLDWVLHGILRIVFFMELVDGLLLIVIQHRLVGIDMSISGCR